MSATQGNETKIMKTEKLGALGKHLFYAYYLRLLKLFKYYVVTTYMLSGLAKKIEKTGYAAIETGYAAP